MEQLNTYLLDTVYNGTQAGYFDTPPSDKITGGSSFGFSLHYQPTKFQNFGFYGNYQFGSITRTIELEVEIDPWTMETELWKGTFTYKAQALSLGVSTVTYLDALLFDENASFWKRAAWGIDLRGGVGFSNFRDKAVWRGETTGFETLRIDHSATSFQGDASMKFEYRLSNSGLLTDLGLKIGYQFLKTKTVENEIGPYLFSSSEGTTNLDFSGIYVGAYLSLGK